MHILFALCMIDPSFYAKGADISCSSEDDDRATVVGHSSSRVILCKLDQNSAEKFAG
jgi:hypothetical protein